MKGLKNINEKNIVCNNLDQQKFIGIKNEVINGN